MFLSGIMPFLDNFLVLYRPDIDDIVKVSYFEYFTAFIWTLGVSISAVLIVVGSFMGAYKYLYAIPLFAHLTMVVAAILNASGFLISGMWQFYIFLVLISIFIFSFFNKIKQYIELVKMSDSVREEIIELLIED